jgi:UDP-N-acetylglucosamine 2-epimerase (non-hydrolysing)
MIDTMVAHLEEIKMRRPYEKFGLSKNKFVYVTLHRPSNVDEKDMLKRIIIHMITLSKKLPIVFPAHSRTMIRLEEFNLIKTIRDSYGFYLIRPVDYHDSISFAMNAKFVITNSGGYRKKRPFSRHRA